MFSFLAAVENRSLEIAHQSNGSPDFYLNTTGCMRFSSGEWQMVDNLTVLNGIEIDSQLQILKCRKKYHLPC